MSEKAKNVIETNFKNLEFLSLDFKSQKYYALNILNVLDVINCEKSKFKKLSSGLILNVESYHFYENKIIEQDIFKIYLNERKRIEIFVSEKFKEIIDSNELIGLEFIEVWDSEKE